MIPNLPFTSLRAFEAVARLKGFGRAAEELGVSQSAVSQQVKLLEEWTKRKLLVRGHRYTHVTAEGRFLAEAVADGLGQIANICSDFRNKRHDDPTIIVSCLPGFAFNWLFPRLIDFDQQYPKIPVSISTFSDPDQFFSGNADVAICYGIGGYTGFHVEKLMDEQIFPVCSPMFAQENRELRVPDDVFKYTLLVDDLADTGGNPPTWAYWAEKLGIPVPKDTIRRRFGQSNMVVQAAASGFGIALGREPLVVDALRQGTLVRPFSCMVDSEFSYWFVCPKKKIASKRIRIFRDWLKAQVQLQLKRN